MFWLLLCEALEAALGFDCKLLELAAAFFFAFIPMIPKTTHPPIKERTIATMISTMFLVLLGFCG